MGINYVVVHASRPLFKMTSRTAAAGFETLEARADDTLRVTVESLSTKTANDLRRDPRVLCSAPSAPMKLHQPFRRGSTSPNDAGASWGIAAVRADKSPYGGTGTTVAVLDTGIDAKHEAFASCRVVTKNFTPDDDHDVDGHGTHCAGTIFGADVDGVRIGVAPKVDRALIAKVIGEGPCSSDVLVKALAWAVEEGAQVISMSLGMDFPGLAEIYVENDYPAQLATSLALHGYRANVEMFCALVDYHTKIALGRGKAILFIAASGNESRRHERADFTIGVAPPAAADGMVSVGALERAPQWLSMAPYSNVGGRICAPGSGVLSAKVGGGLTEMDGTSMAAPHVAGVAALWAQHLAERKRLTTRLLASALEGKATLAGLDPDASAEDFGVGLVQAPGE